MSQMNPTKKNMTNLDLNLGKMVRSVPDWVVDVWHRISFRCHDLWWSFMRCVTCCTISKYLLIRYRKRCMYQMHWKWQLFFYYTNIGWNIDWSNIHWIGWNEWFDLVWFGSTWIQLEFLLIQITEFMRPTFSTSRLFLCSAFSKILLHPRFFFSFLLRHATEIPWRQDLTFFWWSWRCCSCLYC